MVLNKQEAELQLGKQLGYKTTTMNQNVTQEQVNFMPIGTILRLRPFITSDNIVRLEIHPERSSGTIVDGIPQTETSKVTSNVMIPDAATFVIGGLMENEADMTQSGIPVLSRIPILGALFRFRDRTITQKELVVILTPHIWKSAGRTPLPAGATPPATIDMPGAVQRPMYVTPPVNPDSQQAPGWAEEIDLPTWPKAAAHAGRSNETPPSAPPVMETTSRPPPTPAPMPDDLPSGK
jgi:Flp pilus assembly secretin CpaC